jgi:hypothetical protein
VARTGVGVDATGDHVFMVTVDAMNMREFAEYMISLGAERALNFDGGGSTTMVARKHGDVYASLVNKPSEGVERRVSATLQAISTAPTSAPSQLRMKSINQPIVVGSTVEIEPSYALDAYYNVVNYADNELTFTVSNGVGEVTGKAFKALQAGEGRIGARINQSPVGSLAVNVVNTFDRLEVNEKALQLAPGESKNLTAKAVNDKNPQPIFDSNLVKWEVEGNIGTITNRGRFTAGDKAGTGNIVASFNGVKTKIPVTILSANQFKDVPAGYWAYQPLLFLKERGVLRGYEDGTVKPSESLTRAQAASMLVREFNLRANQSDYPEPTFKDISTDYYAYQDIKAIAGSGLMRGNEEGRFDPNGRLTRAQMAVILTRAYKLTGTSPQAPAFKDVTDGYWAYSSIEALALNGIAGGYGDGTFGPGDQVTRAQFAVFLERAIKKYE